MFWKIALRELSFDRMMTWCQIAAVASILAPLLLLFSLRNGILQEIEHRLLNDPQVLSLSLDTSYRLDQSFFTKLAALPEVGFVVPEITALNAIVDLKVPGSAAKISVMVTAVGDPIVTGSKIPYTTELTDTECFINEGLAKRFGLDVGHKVQILVTRVKNKIHQVSRVEFTIRGIISERFVNDDYVLLNSNVVNALDDYRSGYEPVIFSDGSRVNTLERYYAKFRLYAKDMQSVIPLYYTLVEQHFNVRSKVQEIENLQAIDRVLNIVFGVVALVSVIGGAIALGGLMLSSLKAKKRNLVLLRLMGQRPRDTYALVLVEAWLVSLMGFILGLALYLVGSVIFNTYFHSLMVGMVISELSWWHFAVFLGCTLLLSSLTALWTAKYVLLKVQIADILREA